MTAVILIDRINNLLHRDEQPDDIEQWPAELRGLPAATELAEPLKAIPPAETPHTEEGTA